MAQARKGPKAAEPPRSPTKSASTKPASNGSDAIVATVRELAAVVAEHALSELVYDTPELTITLRRGGGGAMPVMSMPMPMSMPAPHAAMHAHAPAAPAPAQGGGNGAPEDDSAHTVTSPFVGTFYRRPNPDSPSYVEINERVDKGQVLCIVEAMKLMNEIEADVAGTVIGILAEDGAPVEYGQPLFKIAPA